MTLNDVQAERPVVENLSESLQIAFGGAVIAVVSGALLRLHIGPKTAWINSSGGLEGEAMEGKVTPL